MLQAGPAVGPEAAHVVPRLHGAAVDVAETADQVGHEVAGGVSLGEAGPAPEAGF